MNDYVPRPRERHDAHWVIKRDLANIIAKYADRGDLETAGVYIEALARYTRGPNLAPANPVLDEAICLNGDGFPPGEIVDALTALRRRN
jgi:hypothetical protein